MLSHTHTHIHIQTHRIPITLHSHKFFNLFFAPRAFVLPCSFSLSLSFLFGCINLLVFFFCVFYFSFSFLFFLVFPSFPLFSRDPFTLFPRLGLALSFRWLSFTVRRHLQLLYNSTIPHIHTQKQLFNPRRIVPLAPPAQPKKTEQGPVSAPFWNS